MNPPLTTRWIGPQAAVAATSDLPDDSGDAPLTGDDLIADLDPGWLAWSERQAGR